MLSGVSAESAASLLDIQHLLVVFSCDRPQVDSDATSDFIVEYRGQGCLVVGPVWAAEGDLNDLRDLMGVRDAFRAVVRRNTIHCVSHRTELAADEVIQVLPNLEHRRGEHVSRFKTQHVRR